MNFDHVTKVHDIGWQWFQIHANQRMQLVSFWFVAMSFLSTGTVLAYTDKRYSVSLLVSLGISITSVIFLFLDLRTRELISYGEHLMTVAEKQIKEISTIDEIEIVGEMHSSNRKTVSYRILFTTLYLTAASLGLVSFIGSAVAI